MAYRSGWRFRLRVNTVAYAATDCGVDATCDPQDVSNTEGVTGGLVQAAVVGYSSVIGGLKSARVNFRNATFNDTDNPFAAPYAIAAGNYCVLRVYLWGTNTVSWNFPAFYISNVSWNAQVRGLQPVNVSGQSDGLFFHPAT